MLRNDYRRALIMLRSLRQGVSGYVRLERRTLLGTMQFTVTGAGADEALHALLLYEQNGLWHACPLDQLGQPRYGQCGMVYRFDPRNLCGRSLENYALVAVAALQGDACELLLAGYLNGTVLTDWQQVKQAVCQALTRIASTLAQAGAIAAAPREENRSAPPVPAIAVGDPAEDEAGEPEEEAAEEKREGEAEERERECEEVKAAEKSEAENPPARPEPDETDLPASALAKESGSVAVPDDEFDTPAAAMPREPQTAGDLLAIDMTRPWPAGIEALRPLFQKNRAETPFEAKGFALIKTPAAAPGVDHCVVGISAANGRPERVLYGVPGQYAPAPPQGLEGYEWRGGQDGGYWITIRPVE